MEKIIEKGTYAAQYGETGALVAMDEYDVTETSNGFRIRSDNVIFGQNGFRQHAEMLVDNQWIMQQLCIVVDEKNIELNASIVNENVRIWQKHGEIEIENVIPLQGKRFFFLYSGALVIPLIWFRGFDFEVFEKTHYQLIPTGRAEVMQIPEMGDANVCHFSINMQIGEITDFIQIKTDCSGKVWYYKSELSQLIIKQQL